MPHIEKAREKLQHLSESRFELAGSRKDFGYFVDAIQGDVGAACDDRSRSAGSPHRSSTMPAPRNSIRQKATLKYACMLPYR